MRARLDNLPPASGGVPAPVPNYEAKQSPLAYAVLAVADFALASQRLLFRVWCLRLLCALASVAASIFVASRLARQLGMTEEFGQAAVCVLLSSQMFYATTAHIANDWLAIPLSALVVSLAIDLYRAPAMGSALRFALSLAAGLLTKASFLAFVPFAAGVVIWLAATRRLSARQALATAGCVLALAGPWYLRNLLLYRDLAGIQVTAGGVPLSALVSAAWDLPWLKAILATARQSLWTGNNSFTAFSSATTTVMLGVIALGLVLHARSWRTKVTAAEIVTIAAVVCQIASLAYAMVAGYRFSGGQYASLSPWYVQPLLISGWCLVFLLVSRVPWALAERPRGPHHPNRDRLALGLCDRGHLLRQVSPVLRGLFRRPGQTRSAHPLVRWVFGRPLGDAERDVDHCPPGCCCRWPWPWRDVPWCWLGRWLDACSVQSAIDNRGGL